MAMRYHVIGMILILFFSVSHLQAAGDISPSTMDKYRQTKASLEQMFKAKPGIYAKEVLEGAQRTLVKAQEGIDARKEKAASQALDMAVLQIEQAQARAEEREAAEKTAVTRARVDKLEQRLTNMLAGKGDEK